MDDTTSEIKEAVDIAQLIGESVRLESYAGKFRGLCPFHDDHRPSFVVDPQFRSYRCWACGAKGDVFTFLQTKERITFIEAKERLAERAGITLKKGNVGRADSKQSTLKVLAWAQELFQNCLMDSRLGAEARQYLNDRGLSEATARRHGLGFAPPGYEWLIHQAKNNGISAEQLLKAGLTRIGDRGLHGDLFRNRLLFPIRDERSRVVGFGGRILPSEQSPRAPKYLNTPATEVYHKSEILYGLNVAVEFWNRPRTEKAPAASKERVLVVMEGYTDCLMAYQEGWETAVATCGTALTARHILKLRSFADRVVLMFDGDPAGQKAAKEATALFLSSEVPLRLCLLPDGLDPCDYIQKRGIDELRSAIENAPDALEFQIAQAQATNDITTVDGQQRALEDVLTTLSQTPEMPRHAQAIKYQLALNKVADSFGASEQLLRRRIREMREQGTVRARPMSPHPAGTEPNDAASMAPMDKRERQIVQLLVAQPGRAGEFEALYPVERVKHPVLRSLVAACYSVYERLGESASVDSIREELNDPGLEAQIMELCEGAPQGEGFDQGLRDIMASLAGSQRRHMVGSASRQVASSVDEQAHIEMLRRLRDGNPS